LAIGIPCFFLSGGGDGLCEARHERGNDLPIMSKHAALPDPAVIMVTGPDQADP
jgi:hypothetical protein